MIEVCAGNFFENVNINDATMHGAPPFNTLDGLQIVGEEAVTLRCPHSPPGSGFDLHANGVTIQGFDISNCASAISVEAGYGRERFTQDSLHDNGIGISFNRSSGDNSVVNNAIYGNWGDGVFDFEPLGDYITSNTVQGNGGNGIELSTTVGVNGSGTCYYSTVISGNEAVGNYSNGVYLNNADCGNIKQNTLLANGQDGVFLNTSEYSVVTANDAVRNGNDGIELNSASTLNSLVNNTMQFNRAFDAADHGSGNTWTNDHCKTTSGAAVCVP